MATGTLAPGAILQNRYRIVNLLADGGMGAVYLARDDRLKSDVALKETFFNDDSLRRAFEREAQLLANLRHAALPKVSDHFSENEGQFLVMEFIPGDDLMQMLARRGNAFPVDKVLEWADQLLGALEYLHSRQPPVIHRDIKPQNIKLTNEGQIILLDFGLAKGTAWYLSQMTTGSSLFGYTPSYAPLEQMNGSGTDARSDLYSLGATLYHLITGERPVDAMTRAQAITEERPDPLRFAHELNSHVTPDVADVLKQSMILNRERRFASAGEMRKALRDANRINSFSGTIIEPATGERFSEGQTERAAEPVVSKRADASTNLLGSDRKANETEPVRNADPLKKDVSPTFGQKLKRFVTNLIPKWQSGKESENLSKVSKTRPILTQIFIQVISMILAAFLIAIVVYYTLRPSNPSSTPSDTNPPLGERKVFSNPSAITPIRGGVFKASGAVQVPNSDGVLFIDGEKGDRVFWMQLDQLGNQVGDVKSIPLGIYVAKPEGITYGGGFFYIVGSQGDPGDGDKNAVARFAFDPISLSVREANITTNFRGFLLSEKKKEKGNNSGPEGFFKRVFGVNKNVPELEGEGEKPSIQGGLNIGGIAWDPVQGRLLLGLCSPFSESQAIVIPIKLLDQKKFTKENLSVARVISLNLEGIGIGDIHYDTRLNSFLIISGPPDPLPQIEFNLWQWNGDPNAQPKLIASLDKTMKPKGVTRVSIGGRDYLLIFGDAGMFQKFDYAESQ
jgi:serine/threonine protein kinase